MTDEKILIFGSGRINPCLALTLRLYSTGVIELEMAFAYILG